jgi:hypothetical protein
VIKRTQKKAIKRQTQIVAEIYQNRTADKGRIFEGFSVAQIKKCSSNESLDITWGICTRNRRSKSYTENLYEFLRYSTENSFRTATSPNLYLTRIRGFPWHNNKIKRIRSGHDSSNDFQDSNKKSTENKTLGYLPRVLFFNAFELGAENCESSNIRRGMKINYRSFVNKALYFIHISFRRPFVIMLWFTQITKKILGTDPVKIIFESFTQSQELARYRYFGSLIICTNNLYR